MALIGASRGPAAHGRAKNHALQLQEAMRGLYRGDHGHEHLAIPIDGRYLPRESLAHVADSTRQPRKNVAASSCMKWQRRLYYI